MASVLPKSNFPFEQLLWPEISLSPPNINLDISPRSPSVFCTPNVSNNALYSYPSGAPTNKNVVSFIKLNKKLYDIKSTDAIAIFFNIATPPFVLSLALSGFTKYCIKLEPITKIISTVIIADILLIIGENHIYNVLKFNCVINSNNLYE